MAMILSRFRISSIVIVASVILSACGSDSKEDSKFSDNQPMSGAQIKGAPESIPTFNGPRANYLITKNVNGYTIQDLVESDGLKQIPFVAKIKFTDVTLTLNMSEQVAQISKADYQRIVELYIAFFNRLPDAEGLSYWISRFKAGMTIDQIANSFYDAGLTYSNLTGYTASMTNQDFVKIIYKNVLGRNEVDAGGLAYWSDALAKGTETRGTLIKTILDSAHTFKGNPTWGKVADLLDNKFIVANDFANLGGVTFNTPTESINKGMQILALVTHNDISAAGKLVNERAANGLPVTNIKNTNLSQVAGKILFAAGGKATVFWDDNNNWTKDPTETSVIADKVGNFIIPKSQNASSVLRAETISGAIGSSGISEASYVLSATANAPSLITPFTTLQQAASLTPQQLESNLGLVTGVTNDVNNESAKLAAAVIVIQLVNREGEFKNDAAAAGAAWINFYTKKILEGQDFYGANSSPVSQAYTSNQLKGFAPPNSLASNPQNAAKLLSARGTPSISAFNAQANLSYSTPTGYENGVPSSGKLRTAVDEVIRNLKNYGVDVARHGVRVDLNSLDLTFMKNQLLILKSAGLGEDTHELVINSELVKRWQEIDSASISAEKWLNVEFLTKSAASSLVSYDQLANFFEFGTGLFDAVSSAPVSSFQGTLFEVHLSWSERSKKVAKFAVTMKHITNALNAGACLSGGSGILEKVFNGQPLNEHEWVRFAADAEKFGGCLIAFLDRKGFTKIYNYFKYSYQAALDVVEIDNPLDDASLNAAIWDAVSVPFGLLAELSKGKIKAILKVAESYPKAIANGYRAVSDTNLSMSEKFAFIDSKNKELRSFVEKESYRIKLAQRLSRVIIPIPPVVRSSIPASACYQVFTKPAMECSLSKPTSKATGMASTGINRAVKNAAPPFIVSPAPEIGIKSIEISYGDGWTSATSPETRGRVLVGGETIRHSYLTYGNYQVITAVTLNDGQVIRDFQTVSINPPADVVAKGSINISPTRMSASLGAEVEVYFDVQSSHDVKDLLAIVRPSDRFGYSSIECRLQTVLLSRSGTSSTYKAVGCSNAITANHVRMQAVITATNTNGKVAAPASISAEILEKAKPGSMAASFASSVPAEETWNLIVNTSKQASSVQIQFENAVPIALVQSDGLNFSYQRSFGNQGNIKFKLIANFEGESAQTYDGMVRVEQPLVAIVPQLVKSDSIEAFSPWDVKLKTNVPIYSADLIFSTGRRIPFDGSGTQWNSLPANTRFSDAGSYPYTLQIRRSMNSALETFAGGTLKVTERPVPPNQITIISPSSVEQGKPYNLKVQTSVAADKVTVLWPDDGYEKAFLPPNGTRTMWEFGDYLFLNAKSINYIVRTYKDGYATPTGEIRGTLLVNVAVPSIKLNYISPNIIKGESPFFSVQASLSVAKVSVKLGKAAEYMLSIDGGGGGTDQHFRSKVPAMEAGSAIPYVITAYNAQGQAVGNALTGTVTVSDVGDSLKGASPVPLEIMRGEAIEWKFITNKQPDELWMEFSAPIGRVNLTGYFFRHTFNYAPGNYEYKLMRRDYLGNVYAIQGASGVLRISSVQASPQFTSASANGQQIIQGATINLRTSEQLKIDVRTSQTAAKMYVLVKEISWDRDLGTNDRLQWNTTMAGIPKGTYSAMLYLKDWNEQALASPKPINFTIVVKD
jgi:hypothetical protein